MLVKTTQWTVSLSQSPHALWALAVLAFLQSSVFPIPADVLMVALILANRTKAFKIALITTVSSVAGGIAGYAIGFGAYETIGRPILEFYGQTEHFDTFRQHYNAWGSWAVFFAGISPFPYKVITILSGATQLSFPVFVVASLLARALRFFLLAWVLWRFGPIVETILKTHKKSLLWATGLVVVGGFLIVPWAL